MTIWADTYNGVPIPGGGDFDQPNRLLSKFCFHVFQTYLSVLNRPRYRFQFQNLTITISNHCHDIYLKDIGEYKSRPISSIYLTCLVNDEQFLFSFRPTTGSVVITISDNNYLFLKREYSPSDKIRKSVVLQANQIFLQAIGNLLLD